MRQCWLWSALEAYASYVVVVAADAVVVVAGGGGDGVTVDVVDDVVAVAAAVSLTVMGVVWKCCVWKQCPQQRRTSTTLYCRRKLLNYVATCG